MDDRGGVSARGGVLAGGVSEGLARWKALTNHLLRFSNLGGPSPSLFKYLVLSDAS